MDDKLKARLQKLQALAERGVGGEKETAERKLTQLLQKNGLNSLEELVEDKENYYLFSYNGKHKRKLLLQIIYRVRGASVETPIYKSMGRRQKVGIYCTLAQKLEIELDYEFYSKAFDDELEIFMEGFIQKQCLFPSDDKTVYLEDLTEEERKKAYKANMYADGITKKTRRLMIEGGSK